MINWKAALDSFFGIGGWNENGWLPEPRQERRGYDPYTGMSMSREQTTGDPNHPASAGLPTLGKRR